MLHLGLALDRPTIFAGDLFAVDQQAEVRRKLPEGIGLAVHLDPDSMLRLGNLGNRRRYLIVYRFRIPYRNAIRSP